MAVREVSIVGGGLVVSGAALILAALKARRRRSALPALVQLPAPIPVSYPLIPADTSSTRQAQDQVHATVDASGSGAPTAIAPAPLRAYTVPPPDDYRIP